MTSTPPTTVLLVSARLFTIKPSCLDSEPAGSYPVGGRTDGQRGFEASGTRINANPKSGRSDAGEKARLAPSRGP